MNIMTESEFETVHNLDLELSNLDIKDLKILKNAVDNSIKFYEFKESGGCENCSSIICSGEYANGCVCGYFNHYCKYPPLAIGDYVECIEFTSTDGRTLYGRGTIVCSNDEEFGKDDEYWVSIATYGGFYKIKRKRNEIRKL